MHAPGKTSLMELTSMDFTVYLLMFLNWKAVHNYVDVILHCYMPVEISITIAPITFYKHFQAARMVLVYGVYCQSLVILHKYDENNLLIKYHFF